MKDDVLANPSKYDQAADADHITPAKNDAQLLADKEAQDRADQKAIENTDDVAHIIIGTETAAPDKYLLNTQRQIVVSAVTSSEKRDANEKLTYEDFHYTLLTEYEPVENKRYTASVNVHKVDSETSEPLEGVLFDLYAATTIRDADNKVIYEENKKVGTFAPTDSEGNTSINDLYPGDYYAVETKSAFGYALNTEKQYLSIQTDDKNVGVDVAVEVTNDKQQLFVKVIKTFEDTVIYYDDIEFEVYRLTDADEYELFGTVVPDENGQLTQLEWLPGSYYIQESKTNDNFVIDETHYEFELCYDNSGEPEIWMDLGIIENQLKENEVTIIKTDNKDEAKLLNGAVFLVKEGEAEFGYVSTGSIFIKHNEQIAPSMEDVEEEIEPEHVIKTYWISMDDEFNEYMEVQSDENGEVLLVLGKELTEEGTYYISDGNETWSVDVVNGKATISNLKATHTYIITEVYAPEKYELNTEPFEFSIDFTDGFTGEYTITNIKQYVPSLGF